MKIIGDVLNFDLVSVPPGSAAGYASGPTRTRVLLTDFRFLEVQVRSPTEPSGCSSGKCDFVCLGRTDV